MFIVYGRYLLADSFLIGLYRRYNLALDLFLQSKFASLYKVVEAKPVIDFSDYRRVHSGSYVDILEKIHETKMSVVGISEEAVEFERTGVGGTLAATRLAIENNSFAYHIGGGYHHGMPDGPHSIDYCNDVAIALALMLEKGFERILYIDLDAHHPNGVQEIFKDEGRILQVSVHCQTDNMSGHYTYIGEKNSLGRRINISIPRHTGDKMYMRLLGAVLDSILERYRPDAIFYQAGVDSYKGDSVGQLSLSLRCLYERDRLVASTFSSDIPFASVLGGGYHPVKAPQAIVNTLAAFAGQDIVFDEQESKGYLSGGRGVRWYNSLCVLLEPHMHLHRIEREEFYAQD